MGPSCTHSLKHIEPSIAALMLDKEPQNGGSNEVKDFPKIIHRGTM